MNRNSSAQSGIDRRRFLVRSLQAGGLAAVAGPVLAACSILIRDRGSNFTASFDAVFQANGTRIVRTPVQAPRMNAICERRVAIHRKPVLGALINEYSSAA